MAREGFVTIPAMRENRSKAVRDGSIRGRGPPQSQHAVEAELIDRPSDAGLLNLPRDCTETERIEGDGSRGAQESQIAEPRDEVEIAYRQTALDFFLRDQPRNRGLLVAKLI